MIRHSSDEIHWYTWNVFEPWKDRFTAVLTTRSGGVSPYPKNSLNLGVRVEDSEANIRENRRRISSALGLERSTWIAANQVHGINIGNGLSMISDPPGECDAIRISSGGLIAAILLADCLPLVLYDPNRHDGMICHAGWRGTVAGMAESAVTHMVERGSHAGDLIASAGPGIGPCCYDVGEEVADIFRKKFPSYPDIVVHRAGEGSAIDLEEANLAIFRQSGIKEHNLGRGGFCTACRATEFFSFRKERGCTGRHAALMALV